MKIEIEINSTYEATMTIDGRLMVVEKGPDGTSLSGILSPTTETTFGGRVACALFSTLSSILSARGEMSDFGEFETWDELEEEVLDVIESKLW